MPKGGFGNLIALPLQKQPRLHSNSVFIDRKLQAYSDQWEYLASIQRISKSNVAEIIELHSEEIDKPIINDSSDEDNNTPWKNPQKTKISQKHLPKDLSIVVANGVYIEKKNSPACYSTD